MFHMQRCMKVIAFIEIQCETLGDGIKIYCWWKLDYKNRLNLCCELNFVSVCIELPRIM